MVQLVRALLAFFVLGFAQALWLMVVAVFMFLVMAAAEIWSGVKRLGRWLVEKLRDYVVRYLIQILGIGTLAAVGFWVAQATCDATQNERLRAVENAAAIWRTENREDHKRIEERLDTLLERTTPTAR